MLSHSVFAKTAENKSEKPPTLKLRIAIKGIQTKLQPYFDQPQPKTLNDDFAVFKTAREQMSQTFTEDEKQREQYRESTDLEAKKRALEAGFNQAETDYANLLKKHDADKEEIKAKLAVIHNQIIEIRLQDAVDQLKKLVSFTELDAQMRNNLRAAEDAIDAESCCRRNCLHTPQDLQAKIDKLKQLQQEVDDLDSSDHSKVRDLMIRKKNQDRDQLEGQLVAIIKQVPKKTYSDLDDQLADLDAQMDELKSKHFHALSREAMYQCFRVYEALLRLKNDLLQVKTHPAISAAGVENGTDEKTPLLAAQLQPAADNETMDAATYAALKKIFADCDEDLSKKFSHFHCPDSNDDKLDVLHKKFMQYTRTGQDAILNDKAGELLERFIPEHKRGPRLRT